MEKSAEDSALELLNLETIVGKIESGDVYVIYPGGSGKKKYPDGSEEILDKIVLLNSQDYNNLLGKIKALENVKGKNSAAEKIAKRELVKLYVHHLENSSPGEDGTGFAYRVIVKQSEKEFYRYRLSRIIEKGQLFFHPPGEYDSVDKDKADIKFADEKDEKKPADKLAPEMKSVRKEKVS